MYAMKSLVPHSLFKQCMMMFGVAENMRKFISTENWNTELKSKRQKVGAMNIRKSIFQGDSL